MEPNGRDNAGDRPRLERGSVTLAEARRDERHESETDLVFDFSGLHSPELTDLALILTARLTAASHDRVWIRALPYGTWRVLRSLRLDHLFRFYPTADDELN